MTETNTHTFFWADAPTDLLREFVEKHRNDKHSGANGVSRNPEDHNGMPIEYQDYVADIFENVLHYPVKEWRYWIGITLPGKNNTQHPEFAKGFPHCHQWDALTAVHYVQVADEGGDLVVCDDNRNVLTRFKAKVGLTAVIDGRSSHGVEAVRGATPRLTVIATGFAA